MPTSPSDPAGDGGRHAGWLLLDPDVVPERWRRRAVPLAMVPLLPGEAEQVLAGDCAQPEIDATDERLAMLAAQGLPMREIAQEAGMSLRGVQARIARLRRRLGVATAAELRTALGRAGFQPTVHESRTRDAQEEQDGRGTS